MLQIWLKWIKLAAWVTGALADKSKKCNQVCQLQFVGQPSPGSAWLSPLAPSVLLRLRWHLAPVTRNQSAGNHLYSLCLKLWLKHRWHPVTMSRNILTSENSAEVRSQSQTSDTYYLTFSFVPHLKTICVSFAKFRARELLLFPFTCHRELCSDELSRCLFQRQSQYILQIPRQL